MENRMGTEERAYIEETVAKYAPDVDKLVAYVPWLEEKYGLEVKKTFDNPDVVAGSMPFPVYDSYMMEFIRTAENTGFMDPNHIYTFLRNKLKTDADIELFISNCDSLKDLKDLGNIVARYVMGGRTKSRLWSEGVKSGILLSAITKMRDILQIYR